MKSNQTIEKFNKIQKENEFLTDWCLYEIEDLSLKSPFKGKRMNNGIDTNIEVELPYENLTGLELWQYSDKLYKLLGDTDHRFIEEFKLNGDTIEVFFGS